MKFEEIVRYIRLLFGTDEFIPLHSPIFNGNEKRYLIECIDSTFVSSVGRFVEQFEKIVAKYTGARYAVATVNGTAALHISLLISGVKREDEVLTQPLTFISTVNAISYLGAKPVFIDVDKDTLGLSPEKLRKFLNENVEVVYDNKSGKKLTVNKKTGRNITACIPMHTFGHPAKIEEIYNICKDYNIILIEDAAESVGSFYKDKHTGTFGLLGILSFNGNKIITTGGGGMILTNEERLAKLAKHLTTQAKIPHRWEYVHDEIGFNYRLINISAAMGVAQMEQLNEFLSAKRVLANNYKKFFDEMEIEFIVEPENSKSNYWLNAVVMKDRKERDEFLEYTNNNGIMTRPVWELINRLDMYNKCQTADLTNSEWLADRIVNIPSSVIL